MRVAVRKATPLFPELVSSHFDFASSFNELLQILGHLTSPLSAII
jgi:hypothetical protein